MEDNNQSIHGNIQSILIQDEMRNSYLDYAMSVIVGRALPDVRDGLKPVHRRILYAMNSVGNYHNKPYLKSARVVGDVIGKYHPHGDSAVYNTIVRLAQDFSMRYQVVDGQGNFGSIDGDNAAAMRYTEIRMQKFAEELLKDLDKDTVDWQPNYDESLKEPVVLPTKIPNLLVNGSTGIAVGMATNVPPHNLSEVIQGLISLLDNKDLSISDLMEIIPGPDFPTAGTIMGRNGIRSAYTKGRGVIKIRAKADIEVHGKNDRERIIVTELPYQVNKAKLIEKIATLVNQKELAGVSDIKDESNRLGIRIVIDVKRNDSANILLNRLYKHTQMEVSFGIIFLSIHNGQPKVMNLKEMLQAFIDHRKEVVVRRTMYELRKAKERAHILAGLKIAVENIDEIVSMIKAAEGPSQAKAQLIKRFNLSEIQAQAILDMRLQRLTGLERDKIVNDYNKIMAEIERLEGILASQEKIRGIIRDEFNEILESYGDKRLTDIEESADEIDIIDLIKNEEVIVTVTHKGYVKRMGTDTYKAQRRGGKGVKGSGTEEDFFINIFTAETHDRLMFFTDKGNVYAVPVYHIPEGGRTSKGRNLVNLIPLKSDEKVKEIISVKESEIKGKFLMMATEGGMIKKTPLEEYERINQNGKKAIVLREGDNIINVRITDGTKDILLCSNAGKVIRFDENDPRAVGRVSQGVKGMNLDPGDKVIGMAIIDDNVDILSITDNGYGKRTSSKEYRKQTRGGKGILAMKLTDKTGNLVQIKQVCEKEDLVIITDKGQVIRMKIAGISLLGRNTQGVRLIKLKDGEVVVAIEKLLEEDEDKDDEE